MRTLRIERGGKIVIDNSPIDINKLENKEEFVSSLLTLDVELSNDMSVSDMIHFFYDLKSFIGSVLSEEYEVVRAITMSCNLPRNYKYLKVYKAFKIEKEFEEDFIYLIPEIELVAAPAGEDGIKNLSGLPIIIDEEINLMYENIEIKSKTKINLYDLMRCFFDDLPSLIKEGLILSK